jgi:hypothetical protein
MEKYPNGVFLWLTSKREFEALTKAIDHKEWMGFKVVRERQLLDWKNSDKDYLGNRERQMEQAAHNHSV